MKSLRNIMGELGVSAQNSLVIHSVYQEETQLVTKVSRLPHLENMNVSLLR